jgi:catechol 2,3-dioxygenase
MSTASAPVEIGRVTLTVNDLPKVAAFYESVLGLRRLSSDGTTALLGTGTRALIELQGDRSARRAARQEAGLFHTAFLMPSRSALARWLIHAAGVQVPLQGASDHHVSEAIYLADPEGNGIEVYADRPRDGWRSPDGTLIMTTGALDLNGLARAADAPWSGIPDDAVVGHVHLQVGSVPEAEAFYQGTLGLPVMAHYPGAAFFGSGGYHHHLAANIWNSRGAGPRPSGTTGLAALELLADAPEHAAILARTGTGGPVDPWGTELRVRQKG